MQTTARQILGRLTAIFVARKATLPFDDFTIVACVHHAAATGAADLDKLIAAPDATFCADTVLICSVGGKVHPSAMLHLCGNTIN